MADMRLADVEASLQELDTISKSVAEYFCEDPSTFKLEECCSIFHSFCERFERATQVKLFTKFDTNRNNELSIQYFVGSCHMARLSDDLL